MFRLLVQLFSVSTSSSLSLPLSCVWSNDNQVSEVSTSWSVALSLQFESLSFKTQSCSFRTQSLGFINQKFKNFVDMLVGLKWMCYLCGCGDERGGVMGAKGVRWRMWKMWCGGGEMGVWSEGIEDFLKKLLIWWINIESQILK